MDISREQLEQQLASDNLGQQLSAINQLRHIDPALAFELIQRVVKDKSARVRYAAISQLSELGKQDRTLALEILKDALHNDSEADVQGAAADSIGGLRLTEAFDDLEQVYHQTSEWLVQMSIVACLGELGEPRAFELLKKALTSPNSLVILAAIGALGELEDERALPLLLPYANDDDWQIRHRLVQAISKYQHPEVQTILHRLTQDPSEIVAESARTHLQG